MGLDPADAIAGLIWDKVKSGIWAEWLKLLFELAYSGLSSFLWGFGASVAAMGAVVFAAILDGKPHLDAGMVFVLGAGAGAFLSAIDMTTLIRSDQSKILRGLKFVLPGAEAAAEINASTQTLTKSDKIEKEKS
jgi:Na+-transporting NADH:ubiquinone oxidoreductase subunit NqrE